jgi:hypothetical protein
MRILQGNRRTRPAHADRGSRYYPTPRLLSRDGVDDGPTRYEPQTLAGREPVTDPYEAWAARRAAEEERARVDAVRWVTRHRGTGGAPISKEAAAAEAVRWVNRYRGVGAAAAGGESASGTRVAERDGGRERPVDLAGVQGD